MKWGPIVAESHLPSRWHYFRAVIAEYHIADTLGNARKPSVRRSPFRASRSAKPDRRVACVARVGAKVLSEAPKSAEQGFQRRRPRPPRVSVSSFRPSSRFIKFRALSLARPRGAPYPFWAAPGGRTQRTPHRWGGRAWRAQPVWPIALLRRATRFVPKRRAIVSLVVPLKPKDGRTRTSASRRGRRLARPFRCKRAMDKAVRFAFIEACLDRTFSRSLACP